MSRERELLERIVTAWEDDRYELIDALYPLIDDARKLLESEKQDQPEPVAYWDTLNNILVPAVPLVSKRTCFKVEAVPLYLHPEPKVPFVRLTEEEVNSLTYAPLEPYELICAVENRLVEKNK